jgi:flagellar M-ring protein FliF
VTGAGNVRASVTLDYDSAATEQTQESYDPNQTVTLSMQRTEQSTGPQPIAAGVPGASSNAPNAQAVPVYPRESSTGPESARTESSTYAASKTVRHTVENPGRVRRLTAAIVVNDRMTQAATNKSAATWQPRSAGELHNLTALAQAAVGFDPARGDVLTVEDIAFDDNRVQQATSLPQRLLHGAESSPLLLKYSTLLACLLLVLAFGIRPALRQLAPAPLLATKAKELANPATAALAAAQPPELDQERIRKQAVYEQVTQQLKREPTQSSRLLQSWIHSD